MSILKIDSIVSRLDGHKRDLEEIGEGTREAAVAAILRPGNHTEAMFILRASREGDPWSGQMAFPGGHRDPEDLSIRHTAERETWEEVGLDLSSHARHLGELDQIRVRPRGRDIDMVVTPVLYVLESEPAVLNPNDEVAEILWGSLDEMYAGTSRTEETFHVAGQSQQFPGYSVGEQVVWGLTMRMLEQFFTMLNPEFESEQDW